MHVNLPNIYLGPSSWPSK